MINDNHGSTILAQSRPPGATAVNAYSPPTSKIAVLSKVIIANTTGSAADASIYIDADGSTYDETTAILFGKSIGANDSESIEFEDGLELNEDGTIGVQTGTNDALTFTVLGRELDGL
ncbi:MAG: hypothetical protein AB7Q01_14995 [Gammaproteobacteria bacterium]